MLSHHKLLSRSFVSPLWLLIVFSLILVPLSHSPGPTPVQAQGDRDSVEYDAIRSLNAGATDSSEQTGDTHVQQLTPTGEIAYIHEGDIYLLDLATGDTEQLTDDGTNRDPAWMPDGEWLAFASNREGNYNIYMMRDDGSQQTRLTDDPQDERFPAYASEETLFFVRSVDTWQQYELVELDIQAGETVIDSYEGRCDITDISAFSPDVLAVVNDCRLGVSATIYTRPDATAAFTPSIANNGGGVCNDSGQREYLAGSVTWMHTRPQVGIVGATCPDGDAANWDTGLFLTPAEQSDEPVQAVSDENVGYFDWSPDDRLIIYDQRNTYSPQFNDTIREGLWLLNVANDVVQPVLDTGHSPAWRPAVAPEPTATPAPTNTPEPTATPAATHTSRSTETSQAPSRPSEQNAAGRIVFTSDRDGNDDIYVMNADGTSQNRLTNDPEDDWDPVWSPDGTQIAFLSRRDGSNEIYVMDADGTNLTNVTNNAARDDYPTWSPDGNRIAYISFRDGNWNVYVMNADGSNQARLTNTAALDVALSWSPDGNRIAVSSTRDGNNEIYVMDADGGNQTRLTNNAATDWAPAWSPDSNRIAFSSNRDGNTDIYVMESDGSNQTRLTNDPAVDDDPTWSPDGRHIAFSSARDGNVDIYVMESDGSNQTRLTDAPTNDRRADWGGLSQQALITPSPVPTVRRAPTGTPEPTDTPVPTDTPEPTDTPAPTQRPRDTAPTSEATPEISLDQLAELPVPAIAQRFDPPDTTTAGLLDDGTYDCVPASTAMVIQYLVSAHELSDVTSDYPSIRRLFRQHQPDPYRGMSPSLVETLLPQLTNNQITAQLNYFAAEHWQESVARQIQAGYPILAIVHNWNLLDGNWPGNEVHAFVITGIGEGKVVYNDPWDGQRYEMTIADFETAWNYTTNPDGSGHYAGYIFTVQTTTAE